jgi:hypothetical protein
VAGDVAPFDEPTTGRSFVVGVYVVGVGVVCVGGAGDGDHEDVGSDVGGDFGGEGGAVEVVDGVGGGAFAGGVGPFDDAGGEQEGSPAVALFDAVVASAQADEVGGVGGADGPGHDVVDVAEPGCDGAAGEAAVSVAQAHESFHPGRHGVGADSFGGVLGSAAWWSQAGGDHPGGHGPGVGVADQWGGVLEAGVLAQCGQVEQHRLR